MSTESTSRSKTWNIVILWFLLATVIGAVSGLLSAKYKEPVLIVTAVLSGQLLWWSMRRFNWSRTMGEHKMIRLFWFLIIWLVAVDFAFFFLVL